MLASGVLMPFICINGQPTHKNIKIKHRKCDIAIGFRSGRELLFNSSHSINNKQNKVHAGISNSILGRKQLSTHVSMEGAISYRAFQTSIPGNIPDKHLVNKYDNTPRVYGLALPVTINYFFFPGKCKVHPYLGAGFQYSLNLNGSSNSISLSSADSRVPENQQGTKYISILFTQGITFQVNTKIQVTQSFHFLPENGNKIIGVDLGIGYQLP